MCVFNQLNNFHVIENKSVDPMHDLPEGIFRVEIVKIVIHCIHKKYFSLKTLNHRLTYFRFNYFKNRPPVVTETDIKLERLKMTASQMVSFVFYKLLRKILCTSLKNEFDEKMITHF